MQTIGASAPKSDSRRSAAEATLLELCLMMQWASLIIALLAGGLLLVASCVWSIQAVRRGEWTNLYNVTVHREQKPLGFWFPVVFVPLIILMAIGLVISALLITFGIV